MDDHVNQLGDDEHDNNIDKRYNLQITETNFHFTVIFQEKMH